MDLMLSIIVSTYGHEKYIAEALDSILSQKTNYPYEILVGEDASPDGTREILKMYEETHPNRFKMYYRPYNYLKAGKNNSLDLRLRAKGKYIVLLEGDDFWIDENKIQKQIDFLENNPNYIGVAHNCIVVGSDSKPNGEHYPECKESEYSLDHFSKDILPGQITTLMYRNIYKDHLIDMSLFEKRLRFGDRPLCFALSTYGKIYVIQETMSAYRHITSGGSSFSANAVFDYQNNEIYFKALLDYAYNSDNEDAVICAEKLYLRHLLSSWKRKKIRISAVMLHSRTLRHRFGTIIRCAKYYIGEKQKIAF